MVRNISIVNKVHSSYRLFGLNTRYANPPSARNIRIPIYRGYSLNINVKLYHLDPKVINLCVINGYANIKQKAEMMNKGIKFSDIFIRLMCSFIL